MRERTRIERDIRGWIGWDFIEKCVDLCDDPLLVMTIFLTGGRATEILELRRDHFSDLGPYYEVKKMPVFKKYDLVRKYKDTTGKTRWVTRKRIEFRDPFPILKANPLANRFWDSVKDVDGKLFEYKIPRSDKLWTDQYWQLYKRIRAIDAPIRPLAPKNKKGVQKNLYPHWFRGMRAAQMRIEYNMRAENLQRFFKWDDPKVALHYARLSSMDLAQTMLMGRKSVQEFYKYNEEKEKFYAITDDEIISRRRRK